MSSLLFLTTNDFNVQNLKDRGMILCHQIRGFSLLLFYSNQCAHCQKILPIFTRLPETVKGCVFGMINMSSNMPLVNIAKQTITPIQYVPLIILYVNGVPYQRYEGPGTEEGIRNFVFKIANDVQKMGFTKATRSRNIPAYSWGVPLDGSTNVCYLEYDKAYYE